MTIYEWQKAVNDCIVNKLEEFYETMYGGEVRALGDSSGYRLNPCPMCGHNDCCTITDIGVNCFSGNCGWKGSHVKAYFKYAEEKLKLKEPRAREKLRDFTKIELPSMTPQEKAEYERFKRRQEILFLAEEYDHKQLMTCKTNYMFEDGKSYTPLEYMMRIRRRSEQTLKEMKVGFVNNRSALTSLLYQKGYTDEEIKDAKIFCYPGLFVFYYKDPYSGYITRINTKNPFNIRKRKMEADGTYTTGDIIKGFSAFSKVFLYTPKFSFSEPFIVVEGEHDLMALMEQGYENVCCAGGNFRGDSNKQKYILENAESTVYCCFDNDAAGVEYTNELNDFLCDKDVRRITFDATYNDIDEYYRDCPNPEDILSLVSNAEEMTTLKFKIKEKNGAEWSISTRDMKIVFVIQKRSDSQGLIGDISIYENNRMTEILQSKALPKVPKKFRDFAIELQQEIDRFYNRGIYSLEFEDLVKIYRFSLKKQEIEKRLAELMNQDTAVESKVEIITKMLGNSKATTDMIDEILKVRNNIKVESSGISFSDIVTMKLAESFDIKGNKGYFYFNYHKVDTDGVLRRLPYLLRSDGELIRLDLFKKADPNAVLLIDGKFELPCEIETAITDNANVSLKDYWVEKFRNDEIDPSELEPAYLIGRLVKYVEKFYYFADDRYYVVIALYIFMTYFYELFSSIPYLYLNGEKGSGKSTLAGIVNCFAFNSKFAVDISESALFRSVSVEGGTFILDEMENLTSRAKSQDSKMASILKGGYYKEGRIYRTNTDQGNRTESYSAYGPKVFANIFGLDDVIEDRCIQIKIPKINVSKGNRRESLQDWLSTHQPEREEMTSKLALCALVHFKEVSEIYSSAFILSSSSRLSQILQPILAVAKFCDKEEIRGLMLANEAHKEDELVGTYEKTFTDFCTTVLAFLKESVENGTPEGIIKNVVYEIAREFLDLVPEKDKQFTNTNFHKYTAPIIWDENKYTFIINALHIKTFVEESSPENKSYTIKNNKTVMNIFNLNKEDVSRKFISVSDTKLVEELNYVSRPRMWVYKISVPTLFPELIAEKKNKENQLDESVKNIVEDINDEESEF